MTSFATHFTHAITRRPAQSIVAGLRAADTGNPDPDLFLDHHRAYVQALRAAGAVVIELAPLEAYPDCVFVEDTALCLKEGAIIMQPGAPTRHGEAAEMMPTLQLQFSDVRRIEGGTIEGGDILLTDREILVGRSARTNAAGIADLRAKVADWGYQVRELQTPPGVLHFKTDCGLLDAQTILSTHRLARTGCFDGYKVLPVPVGEEAAANAVRFNDVVLLPAGFPKTQALLVDAGFNVVALPNTEAAKVDGGMSCLSLRFTPTINGA